MTSSIDLNEVANHPKLSLSILSNQDEDPKDACIRRVKEMVLFFVAVILISSAFVFCAYIILGSVFSEDNKKWATVIAGSIISAFLGYLTGKNIR